MKLLEQKKDTFSIVLYSLLFITLFSLVVTVPMMAFFSKSLVGYFSTDALIQIFGIFVIAIILVLIALLIGFYWINRLKTSATFNKQLEKKETEFKSLIDSRLKETAVQKIFTNGLDLSLKDQISNLAREQIASILDEEKQNALKDIKSSETNALTAIETEKQESLKAIENAKNASN